MTRNFPYDASTQTDSLDLINDLCYLLYKEKINYCHWKSNSMIDRSASGKNDLDLLVSHSDIIRFTNILFDLGFKQAVDPSKGNFPGIVDYFGLDRCSGKLVHVHAHYCLILGHDSSKNYHLPIEEQYLATSSQCGLFRLPMIEFEFILFILRMVLKHSTWETILIGQGHLSASESQELEYFKDQISFSKVNDVLQKYIPKIKIELFMSCIQVIDQESSLKTRIKVGHQLQESLSPFARHSKLFDSWLILSDRPKHIIREHLLGKDSKMRFINGGLLVAIVGGDGAGKTTAVQEISKWLSEDFKVLCVHMGKPKWSLTTTFIRGILKIGRSLGLYPFMEAEIKYTNDPQQLIFPGFPWSFREICTARDRYLTYTRAERFSSKGGISLCDRYPLPEIQYMDGAQIEWLGCKANPRWLVNRLVQLENHYYRRINLPDVIVVLKTDPNLAIARKIDEDSESVWARSMEVWEMDWDKIPSQIVDANLSKEEVVSHLKQIIWSNN